MGVQHSHHHHHLSSKSTRNIAIAFALNLSFAIIELIGGILVGSVAIISDALHDFGDAISLGLALFLERLANKAPTDRFSYGYRRLSLLAALITALTLIIGGAVVLAFAVPRLWDPVQPHVEGMMLLALFGLSVNGYAAYRLHGGDTMNERVLSWHLLEDVLGWAAVLLAAVVMYFVDLPILDPILSILITIYILWAAMRATRKAIDLFLQAVPDNIDLDKIKEGIKKLQLVSEIDHLHVWSLDGDKHVITLHLAVNENATVKDLNDLKLSIEGILGKHGRFHLTLECAPAKTV